ncbi:MAG: (2Fe-2S)-binding protein [Syntrophorhabdales bacterium]|jgi:carbon-monoxide dehydrogenase small subunit
MSKQLIALQVNGVLHEVAIRPTWTLLEVLRETVGLTGTKEGCNVGECGACTVLVDGKPLLACLTLAIHCVGKEVLTIEGLATGGRLHALQQAFIDEGAVQCGFCTPGLIMMTKAILDQNPTPTETEIRQGIAGNLCRCTGYTSVVKAVTQAAQVLAKGQPEKGIEL